MNELGSYLRKKREEKDITVEEVASRTNMRVQYIEAIENHNFDVFPATVYIKGFIRNYADFLDLDPDALVREYDLNFGDAPDGEQNSSTDGERNIWYWATVTVVILAALVVVLFRFAWVHADRSHSALESGHRIDSTPGSPAAESSRVRSDDSPDLRDSMTDDGRFEISLESTPERLNLTVLAREKTWIFAIFDGLEKREMMLQAGERRSLSAKDTILLRLGNAGGIKLVYQGRPLPPLGSHGEVVDKIVTLKDGSLEVRTARLSSSRSGE